MTYLDANNLYGWAMSKPLPTIGFTWMSDEELNNWTRTSCILEVDLECPEKLHDLPNDYPLALESIIFEQSDVAKLIPNLNDKKKWCITLRKFKVVRKSWIEHCQNSQRNKIRRKRFKNKSH